MNDCSMIRVFHESTLFQKRETDRDGDTINLRIETEAHWCEALKIGTIQTAANVVRLNPLREVREFTSEAACIRRAIELHDIVCGAADE